MLTPNINREIENFQLFVIAVTIDMLNEPHPTTFWIFPRENSKHFFSYSDVQ